MLWQMNKTQRLLECRKLYQRLTYSLPPAEALLEVPALWRRGLTESSVTRPFRSCGGASGAARREAAHAGAHKRNGRRRG